MGQKSKDRNRSALAWVVLGILGWAPPSLGQTPPQIRRVNAALAQSLRLFVAPPSLAQLYVVRAQEDPQELTVGANYSYSQGPLSLGLHIQELTFRGAQEDVTLVGAMSFSPKMRKALAISLQGAVWEPVLQQKLDRFLGPARRYVSTEVLVQPLRHLEWEVHLAYRSMVKQKELVLNSLDCDLELSPQLLRGKCRARFNPDLPQWTQNRGRTQEFISGLLRAEPSALQWWVDFAAAWDAVVHQWMNDSGIK